jgi:hypothetical protein
MDTLLARCTPTLAACGHGVILSKGAERTCQRWRAPAGSVATGEAADG